MLCLDLPTYELDLIYQDSKKLIDDINSVYLLAIDIKIEGYYSLICAESLVIIADSISTVGVTLSAKKLWIEGNKNVNISQTQLTYEFALDSSCSCENKKSECILWKFKYPYLFENTTINMSLLNSYTVDEVVTNSLTVISY